MQKEKWNRKKEKCHWQFIKIQVACLWAAWWNWHIYQQYGISLVEIPQESAGMGTACAATDLTPGLGFSHRCGSKVNSVKRVKGVLESLWSFPSFHCTFIATIWNPWAQPFDDIIPFLSTNFWKRLMYQQSPSKEGYGGYPFPSWLRLWQ